MFPSVLSLLALVSAGGHRFRCPGFQPLGHLIIAALLMITLIITLTASALANGGTVQVSNTQAGPYLVSVFTSPNPIRVGTVDVSVLVQRPGATDVVEDVIVMVAAEPAGQTGKGSTFEATHEQATNKLYYAANVALPSEGRWRLETIITGPSGDGELSFEVEATREGLLDKPLVLVGLMALPVFAVLAWLVVCGRPTTTLSGGG